MLQLLTLLNLLFFRKLRLRNGFRYLLTSQEMLFQDVYEVWSLCHVQKLQNVRLIFWGISPPPFRPELWGLPLPKRQPQISIHICEKRRKGCRNAYMKPFPNLNFLRKKKANNNKQPLLGGRVTKIPWADKGKTY